MAKRRGGDSDGVVDGAEASIRAIQRQMRQDAKQNRRRQPAEPFPFGQVVMTMLLCAGGAAGGLMLRDDAARFGSYELAAKHEASIVSCEVVRKLELAPAAKGQPGYWAHLDVDKDGWACES